MSATGAKTQAAQDEFRAGGWSPRFVLILFVMVLIPEFSTLISLYPVNALGQIAEHFGTDQVAWIPATVSLIAVLNPVIGKLADRYGKKRIVVAMVSLGIIGLLVSTFAPTYGVLIFGRVLQAPMMACGFLLPSLVRDIFPTKTIAVASSVALTGAGIFTVVAQLFVAPIIENFGWRGTFWVPAILGAVVLLLVLAVIPESGVREQGGRIDLVGATLIGVGVGGILLGISFGGTWGWTSPLLLGVIALGVIALILWVLQALRAKHPIVDIREIAHAPIISTMMLGSIGSALSGWFYAIIAIIALHPVGDWGLGLTPTQQGYIAALWSLGGALGGFLGGYALSRIAGPKVLGTEIVVMTAMYILAFFGLQVTWMTALAAFVIGMMGAGLASGSMYMIMRLIAQQRQATVSSINMLMIGVISGAVPVILFAVMNAYGARDAATGVVAYSLSSMTAATLVPVGIGIVGILFAILLGMRIPKAATVPSHQLAKQAAAEGAKVAA